MADKTVAELFVEVGRPDLAEALEREGGFWPRVKDNSIPNSELVSTIRTLGSHGSPSSQTLAAARELLLLRAEGKLPTPHG